MIYNEEDERSLILALKRILEERIKSGELRIYKKDGKRIFEVK